ncbi:Coq4 family protein [Pyxidicoccus sp. 3LG]
MGGKVRQGLVASWRSLRAPLEPENIGMMLDAFADAGFMQRLRARLVADLTPEQREHLRGLMQVPTDVDALLRLPEDTFGHHFARHLRRHGFPPDGAHVAFPAVNQAFARDWILGRFARLHDMLHVLLGFDITPAGEVAMQLFHFVNFGELHGALALAGLPLLVYHYGQPREMAREMKRAWTLARQAPNLFVMPVEELLPLPLDEARRRIGILPRAS